MDVERPGGRPISLTWLPITTSGFMVGDYISTSFSGAPAFPAFAVAGPPSGTTLDEAMFTVRGGLSVGASTNPAHDQLTIVDNSSQTSSTITDSSGERRPPGRLFLSQ